ncbi:MAG TPA: hypothetical protein VHS09_00125, partial [Polyangiaceae bacterium]|nr:hypothetical protein [Polyangiaceae bacterium]
MPASAPPPPKSDAGSFVVRFGTAVGLGAIAALAAAVPATLRVSSVAAGGAATWRVWFALAAAALVPMVAAVVVLRGAREGLRAFAGPGAGLRAAGAGLWLAALLVGLTLFGRVLRASTHQHALAGVTFAFGALFYAAGSAVVCGRVVSLARGAPEFARRGLLLILGTAAVLALVYVGLRFVHGASHDAASYGAAGTVVDVLAFGLAAFFASRRSLVARRAIAMVGPPIAVVVVALGVTALRTSSMRDAVSEAAPVFA